METFDMFSDKCERKRGLEKEVGERERAKNLQIVYEQENNENVNSEALSLPPFLHKNIQN